MPFIAVVPLNRDMLFRGRGMNLHKSSDYSFLLTYQEKWSKLGIQNFANNQMGKEVKDT